MKSVNLVTQSGASDLTGTPFEVPPSYPGVRATATLELTKGGATDVSAFVEVSPDGGTTWYISASLSTANATTSVASVPFGGKVRARVISGGDAGDAGTVNLYWN